MPPKTFSLFDFVVYGIRAVLENIRLFVLTFLTFIATMIGAVIAAMLIVLPIIMKIGPVFKQFKQQLMTCPSMQQCIMAKKEMFWSMWAASSGYSILLFLAGVFLLYVGLGLMLGWVRIALDLRDKGKSHPRRLFACFYLVPKFFVSSIFVMVAISAGFAAFIIPGIYLMIRFYFFTFYLVDKDAGIIECMRLSYRSTKGFGWDVLGLIFLLPILSGMVPFFGMFAALMMLVAAYKKLPSRSVARKRPARRRRRA